MNGELLWIWETLRRPDGPRMLQDMAWTTFEDFLIKLEECSRNGSD